MNTTTPQKEKPTGGGNPTAGYTKRDHAIVPEAGQTVQPLTMTSREIAGLTDKRHDHVLRDIRTMLITLYGAKEVDEGIPDKDVFEVFCDRMGWGIAAPKLGNERIQGVTVVRDQRGFVSEIGLDYTHSMTVVSGYNVKLRKVIIDRWQQLEAQVAATAPAPAFTIPATFSAALMLAAQQAQQIEQQQAQLTQAAPKVEFFDRYADATGLKGFREVAKLLKANEREFRDYLIDNKIMYRLGGVLTANQPHIDADRFEVKTGTSEATGHNYNRTLFICAMGQVMSFDRTHLPEPVGYFEERGLVLTGPARAKWRTTACTFHGGSDSMRINTQTGAWVCMAGCGAKGGDVLAYEMALTGADFITAAQALGAWTDDGKPPPTTRPAPLSARDALAVLSQETTLVAVAAGNVARGVQLSHDDLTRLMTAAGRINTVAGAFA